jgi:hypothetical protein
LYNVARIFMQLLFLFTALAAASQTATLVSDKDDYPPGSTATLTGTGFQPGEIITMQVFRIGELPADVSGEDFQPWQVIADIDGGFVTTWHVCNECLGATLRATAIG